MSKEAVYLDPSAPLDLRVKDLLKRMSLEEKAAQLGAVWSASLEKESNFEQKSKELLGIGIGQITRLSGALEHNPGEGARIANEIQRFLIEKSRLRIPAIVHEECLSGFMTKGATAFPQIIGLAGTWDPALVREITSVIKRQMRASGSHQGLAPVLDVVRDPRWGRTEETFGEDQYLVARMGVAYVMGLQGEDLRSGVIATTKHFAAHGFPEGGRNCAPVHACAREFREVFLFPFEAAVKLGGAMSVMNAYHEIDGIPCASNRMLLTEILRGEWGFEGYVASDYDSIRMLETFHHTASGMKEAAVQAIDAGLDVELSSTQCYGGPLIEAVKDGTVSEVTLDKAVSRVLRVKFLLGLFERAYVDVDAAVKSFDTSQDRELALVAARESIVLLKNDGILPLQNNLRSIAVVGPNAASGRNLLGDYSFTPHIGSFIELKGEGVRTVSVLEGLRNRASGDVRVEYAMGCEILDRSRAGFESALEAARKSDIVIAVMGERSGFSKSDVSGEGNDRTTLCLPGVQEELMRALCDTGKPVILILVNGRPITLGWMLERCHAVVEAWLPGEEGGNAVADVIFGNYNPGGKLPISFPIDVGQVPIHYNRKPSSFRDYISLPSRPLFPFGHGLSYTKFKYDDLELTPNKVGANGQVRVRLRLKNVGGRAGDEVVQLYVKDSVASVARPEIELKGFCRVHLEEGETRTIEFTLFVEQLAFYDRGMKLVIEPGSFEVMVGSSSQDIRLRGNLEIEGKIKVVQSRAVFFSGVKVT